MASSNRISGPRGPAANDGRSGPADAGELDRIREILVGGVSRNADERFAALEQRLESALAELSTRVDVEIARLRDANETRVGREQLAALLSETATRLIDDGAAPTIRDEAA